MRHLLIMLMMLVFGLAQASAAPYALCRHASSDAHHEALASSDRQVAEQAHGEDVAAAVSKLSSLSDRVAAHLASGVLPDAVFVPLNILLGVSAWTHAGQPPLHGRSLVPLLHPPA